MRMREEGRKVQCWSWSWRWSCGPVVDGVNEKETNLWRVILHIVTQVVEQKKKKKNLRTLVNCNWSREGEWEILFFLCKEKSCVICGWYFLMFFLQIKSSKMCHIYILILHFNYVFYKILNIDSQNSECRFCRSEIKYSKILKLLLFILCIYIR